MERILRNLLQRALVAREQEQSLQRDLKTIRKELKELMGKRRGGKGLDGPLPCWNMWSDEYTPLGNLIKNRFGWTWMSLFMYSSMRITPKKIKEVMEFIVSVMDAEDGELLKLLTDPAIGEHVKWLRDTIKEKQK